MNPPIEGAPGGTIMPRTPPALVWLPNAVTLLRLAGAPLLVALAAGTGSRTWFAGVFGGLLLTDALDGFLARRLQAVSDLGRRLDSYADYAIILSTVAGLCMLWPVEMRREWVWFAVGLGTCFASTLYQLARWRTIPGFHTRFAKALAIVFPVTLVALLTGWTPAPFHIAVGLQVLSGAEEIAIAIILPGYSGEMASVGHAWLRRQRTGKEP